MKPPIRRRFSRAVQHVTLPSSLAIMREIIPIVQDIRDALVFGVKQAPNVELAAAYVQVREVAAKRLAEVAAALKNGNEYQALRLAEIEPRLPNFIAHIVFPEEAKWIEYCRLHQLAVPPPLDHHTIQSLQKLYIRGITNESPFYHDCRAAIAAGDDEKALQLIRSIVRLNPSDMDAKAEMNRRLQTKLTPKLMALRSALEQKRHEVVLGVLDEIEQAGLDSVLMQDPVYTTALNLRTAIAQHNAAIKTAELLTSSEAEFNQNNWEAVNGGIQRIRRLENQHRLTLSPEQTVRIRKLEKFVADQHLAAAKQLEFERAVASLCVVANGLMARLESKVALTIPELEKMDTTLAKGWSTLEEYHLRIPDVEFGRLTAVASALKLKLAARRKFDRRKKMAALIPLVGLVCGVVWLSYAYARAHTYMRQLEELQHQKLAGAARHLLLTIGSSAMWGVNSMPFLKAKMNQVGQWTELEHQRLATTELQLDEIEAWVGNHLAEMTPEELMKKLDETASNVKQLTPDHIEVPQQKLDSLRGKVKERFKAIKAENVAKVQTKLDGLNQMASGLDFNRPSSDLAATLTALEAEFAAVAKCDHPTIPDLRLPPELNASLTEVRKAKDAMASEIQTLDETKKAMDSAAKLEDYKAALDSYARLRFAEVRNADPILTNFSSVDDSVAGLFFGGNLEVLAKARQQAKMGYKFLPDSIAKEEMTQLLSIRTDPNLKATGSNKNLMASIGLAEGIDTKAQKVVIPLIPVIDAVVGLPQADPVLKGYLIRKLCLVMQPRMLDWGWHYCPQLAIDMAELDAIPGVSTLRSGDWKSAKVQEKLGEPLKAFFTRVTTHPPYFELASAYQHLVAEAALSGINYAGFVDDKLALHVHIKDMTTMRLLGIAEPSGCAMALAIKENAADPNEVKALRKWSPLFIVSADLRRQESKTISQQVVPPGRGESGIESK